MLSNEAFPYILCIVYLILPPFSLMIPSLKCCREGTYSFHQNKTREDGQGQYVSRGRYWWGGMDKTILKKLGMLILLGLLTACGEESSNGGDPEPIDPIDHSTAAGLACASSSCHDGVSPRTYKSPTHPVTSELC
ncbi:MAG: hypothetical protein OEY67_04935 [Gammaproteobacteria bacterium]|nr:hypothetical protein [Gammaproteobacteria bacterium]